MDDEQTYRRRDRFRTAHYDERERMKVEDARTRTKRWGWFGLCVSVLWLVAWAVGASPDTRALLLWTMGISTGGILASLRAEPKPEGMYPLH